MLNKIMNALYMNVRDGDQDWFFKHSLEISRDTGGEDNIYGTRREEYYVHHIVASATSHKIAMKLLTI